MKLAVVYAIVVRTQILHET